MFSKKFTTVVLTLAVIISQVSFPEPAKALGTPRIVSISPGSPSPVGSRVCIRAEVSWDSDFRSMRIRFGNEGWNESAEINFERCFETGHLSAGGYTIRVEVAKVNEGWESATYTEQGYELTQQNNEPPPPNNPQVSCSVSSFEVWPNPATAGETIHIVGSGSCNTQVRATKVKINGGDYYEIGGATTLDTTWSTSSAGNYNLTLLVAGEGDNGWQNAASQNISLQIIASNEPQQDDSSNNPNDVFQHRDIIQIGNDIFVIIKEGSAIQRRLVPNPETLDALGISRSWINNRGFTNNQLKSIGQGSDIPDIVRDPDGFEAFKNTYFSDSQPVIPQQNNNNSQNNVEVAPGEYDPHAKGVCDGWETRLWIGAYARVTNQGDQLKLRTGPSLQENVIDKLPSGYKFMVIGGPTCVDTYTWWNIQGEGGAGWAAEAGDRWWMAPMTEPPQLAELTPSSVEPNKLEDEGEERIEGTIPSQCLNVTLPTATPSFWDKLFSVQAADNRFSEGQCTWYVYDQRPDVADWIPSSNANAHTWDDSARVAGLSVDNNPQKGDIVVWEKSCGGGYAVNGHVAFVTDVYTKNDEQWITVDEANVNGDGQVHLNSQYKVKAACMSFIHNPGQPQTQNEPENQPNDDQAVKNNKTIFRTLFDWIASFFK